MQVKFLGCGDAFGSGGRLNTCFLVNRGDASFLIDCGASAMISIRRYGVNPNSIGAIILSHLHADHFGGLPFFILDAQLVSRRTRPLLIAGPKGLGARLDALMEAHFPGSTKVERKFPIELIEISPERLIDVGLIGVRVSGYAVMHPSGTPSLALRIECDDKILTYTGRSANCGSVLLRAQGAVSLGLRNSAREVADDRRQAANLDAHVAGYAGESGRIARL
jgi:ribonuclease BN (tRNA processing enzyme)